MQQAAVCHNQAAANGWHNSGRVPLIEPAGDVWLPSLLWLLLLLLLVRLSCLKGGDAACCALLPATSWCFGCCSSHAAPCCASAGSASKAQVGSGRSARVAAVCTLVVDAQHATMRRHPVCTGRVAGSSG